MPTKKKVEEVVVEPDEKSQSQMTGMLRRVLLATIGAAVIAQEEIEALVNRLVERGEIAEKDGKKLIQEMMDKRKKKTAKVEEEINKNIEGALERMNAASKADIDMLNQKVAAIAEDVENLKKS
jgi:poly(hydroxyalkanoate) granule-associated protein